MYYHLLELLEHQLLVQLHLELHVGLDALKNRGIIFDERAPSVGTVLNDERYFWTYADLV